MYRTREQRDVSQTRLRDKQVEEGGRNALGSFWQSASLLYPKSWVLHFLSETWIKPVNGSNMVHSASVLSMVDRGPSNELQRSCSPSERMVGSIERHKRRSIPYVLSCSGEQNTDLGQRP